jgi:hypothetical protein
MTIVHLLVGILYNNIKICIIYYIVYMYNIYVVYFYDTIVHLLIVIKYYIYYILYIVYIYKGVCVCDILL